MYITKKERAILGKVLIILHDVAHTPETWETFLEFNELIQASDAQTEKAREKAAENVKRGRAIDKNYAHKRKK